ncbi:hypothetical protein WJX74_007902 [Apatococcus lobatus]|uniref:Phosphoribosyl-AMP cyclohydrolase domain-containing protein n=1 Tax=Apatococcus lobatus TaxID=904363 RepID=A0AAW1S2L2_9CHLO
MVPLQSPLLRACSRRPVVLRRTRRRQAKRPCQRNVCCQQQQAAVSPAPAKTDALLDSLKWDQNGLITAIVQHVDTGEVLMQAFANRLAVQQTLLSRRATFYSRSRREQWCKGDTSGNHINVLGMYLDCDKDALIYLGDPVGPSCHTGAHTCWFTELQQEPHGLRLEGEHTSGRHVPRTTLYALEATIAERRAAMSQQQPGEKPSWTAKLLSKPELLCSKIREEAGELCQTLEENEGSDRAASEMADLLYHSMVLLNLQEVPMEKVLSKLRQRFATSGVEEKESRKAQ